MEQVQVQFVRENRTVLADRGITLLAVQTEAGLRPDAPCGGQGKCGKCLVEIRSPGETAWREVLACRTEVTADLEVRTREAGALRVLTRGVLTEQDAWEPWLETVEVTVHPCPAGESTADWDRFTGALAELGRGKPATDLALASALNGLLRQSGGRITAALDRQRALALWTGEKQTYMAAFDVGTTSIAGYLLRSDRPETVATAGEPNPQAQFGADVIQRANYALENGVEALSSCVRGAVDELLGELCRQANIPREDVLAVSLVGNTCMHHLFLGVSPGSLVRSPYNPAVSEPLVLRAVDFGIHAAPGAALLMLPVIAGFVGADTVGCLLAVGWERLEKLTLLIDIGTNGEIVLGTKDRMIACSTAAGPAFEGAKIQCGMRGAPGAVDHVTWAPDGGLTWSVIGDQGVKGICGSGLIDLVAALRHTGAVDESGRLTGGTDFRVGDTPVVLTQRDVREVQLAKGAISAGIRLLAQRLGVTLEDIQQVYIAGAFGSYMDPDSACDIGLIPAQLRGKILAVGNAAGEGARLALQSRAAWDRAQSLARQTEFLELASLPQFQDEFVDSLEFPELEEMKHA